MTSTERAAAWLKLYMKGSVSLDERDLADLIDDALEARENEVQIGLIEALNFYADPETYFAISLKPDRPCGPFMEDVSVTKLGPKPGKKARETLESLALAAGPEDDED